jgi:FtsP/CotA-like multicopper oxidase with cupredoxin domain
MISRMQKLHLLIFAILCFACFHAGLRAQGLPSETCARPGPGSIVPEPRDLRSQNGVLKVDLTVRNTSEAGQPARFCYISADGSESPTLRLHPGDLLILDLKNDLVDPDHATVTPTQHHLHAVAANSDAPCTSGAMTSISTNLHFHGLTVPPVCHQDDVLKTSIQPE